MLSETNIQFLVSAKGNLNRVFISLFCGITVVKSIFFFFADEGRIAQSQKRKFNEDLKVFFKNVKTNGLTVDSQKAVTDVALHLDLGIRVSTDGRNLFRMQCKLFLFFLDDRTFQNLILCLIPKKKVPKKILDDLLLWLLIHYSEKSYEVKVSWVLDWIAC